MSAIWLHSETSSSLKKLLSLNFWNHSQLHRRMGLLLRLACLQTWSQSYHRGELHVDRGQELRYRRSRSLKQ